MQVYSIAIAMMLSAAASLSAPVFACECSPAAVYHAQPGDGADNVPRDIAPVLEGAFDPATISLEDEDGVKLAFALNVGPRFGCLGGWAELLPSQPLAANARFTIRVAASQPDALAADKRVASITFTTGSDELADVPLLPPPLTAASVLRGAPDCGGVPVVMACIGGLEQQTPADVELIARRGNEILLRITSLIQNDGNYGMAAPPDCIELRRRARDGRRSEPTKICGDALLTRDYLASEATPGSWVACKDGILGDRDAYEDDFSDAGISIESRPDASAAEDAARLDPSGPSGPEMMPSSSGCSVVSSAQSDQVGALLSVFGCVTLLGASRRRKPR